MDNKLIFNLGLYNGEDCKPFLKNGYTVVGVDCNPDMVSLVQKDFSGYIESNKLVIVDKCVTDNNDDEVSFYICKYHQDWSSCNKNITIRTSDEIEEIKSKTVTLDYLIKEYGCPYYCKIDIEGNDILALKSLYNCKELPKYISCETECLGKGENPEDINFLEVLDVLHDLGYTKFYIMKQYTNKDTAITINNGKLTSNVRYIPYSEMKKNFKQIRDDHYNKTNTSFWYDLYATY